MPDMNWKIALEVSRTHPVYVGDATADGHASHVLLSREAYERLIETPIVDTPTVVYVDGHTEDEIAKVAMTLGTYESRVPLIVSPFPQDWRANPGLITISGPLSTPKADD